MSPLYFEKRKFNPDLYNITGYIREAPFGRERVRGQLSRMPGSPTIWVSHGLNVPTKYRRKGFSTKYNDVMLTFAFSTLKASAVIASVKYDNATQQWRLEKLGWDHISRALWIMRPDPIEESSDSPVKQPCARCNANDSYEHYFNC
jgi:RimJ/RimL family protein N-acetyltransferase